MRRPRLKVPSSAGTAYYHCLSRVTHRQRLFDDPEKERFASLMRECEWFCRVRVLTFAIMNNHFHILVEVPQRPGPSGLPRPDEIVADLKRLTGHQFPGMVRQRFKMLRDTRDAEGLATYLASFHARMYDVSAFMKLLKQRFTQWFNGETGTKGTLWEERFRSVLVEGAGDALVTMAAYIDLNPVRAGLVKDPKSYRWCGYAEALAGRQRARAGVQAVARALRHGHTESVPESLATYRQFLFLEGDERRQGLRPDGSSTRGAFSAEEVARVLAAKGKLPLADYLRCRVRYFNDGVAFGSRKFVDEIFRSHRKRFGPKRRSGPRKLRGLSGPLLFTLRDLQVRVFGRPDG